METSPIRVVVVDDHPVVRRGLVSLLATMDGVEVVAEAADGEQAVREVVLARPDVVLMDLQLPGIDGIEATRRVRAQVPGAAVLVLTMYDDDGMLRTALAAGARGYLLKGAEQEEIARALRAVVAGEAIFGAQVAARVLERFAEGSGGAASGGAGGGSGAGPVAAGGPWTADRPVQGAARGAVEGEARGALPELTRRERDILDRLARGHRTARIAQELYLSPKTVSNNLTTIFLKLGVAGAREAAVVARDAGLGRAGPDPRPDPRTDPRPGPRPDADVDPSRRRPAP